jgi:hypothetical protein
MGASSGLLKGLSAGRLVKQDVDECPPVRPESLNPCRCLVFSGINSEPWSAVRWW